MRFLPLAFLLCLPALADKPPTPPQQALQKDLQGDWTSVTVEAFLEFSCDSHTGPTLIFQRDPQTRKVTLLTAPSHRTADDVPPQRHSILDEEETSNLLAKVTAFYSQALAEEGPFERHRRLYPDSRTLPMGTTFSLITIGIQYEGGIAKRNYSNEFDLQSAGMKGFYDFLKQPGASR